MPAAPRLHRLEASPASVRAARRAVAEAVEGRVDGDALDRLLLCASETVTNAIEHGQPPIELAIEVDDRSVRVHVRDSTSTPLAPNDPGPDAVRGRGLLIVERCADAWGVDVHPAGTGKDVWFEIRY